MTALFPKNKGILSFLRGRLGHAHRRGRSSLNEFISLYLDQIANGVRQTDRGRNYASSTVKTVRYSLRLFARFQEAMGRLYDFPDMDMAFYYNYTSFLKKKGALPFCRGAFRFFAAFDFHFVVNDKAVAAIPGVFPDEIVRDQEGLSQPFASVQFYFY